MRTTLASILMCMMISMSAFAGDTLFDRLGGSDDVKAVVNRTIDLSVADPRIASTFENTNLVRLKKLLFEQICQLTGGPCTYNGRDMRKSHAHLKIRNFHFNALVENMQTAMDEAQIPNATQNELLAILAPMQRDVTAGTDASIPPAAAP